MHCGDANSPLVETAGPIQTFRVFRNATPLNDPATGELLGYEAQYLGRAQLQRSEIDRQPDWSTARRSTNVVPATIDIVAAREEMRAGDRLLPEPPRQLLSYAPRAPEQPINGTHRLGLRQCGAVRGAEPGGGHQQGHRATASRPATCWPS